MLPAPSFKLLTEIRSFLSLHETGESEIRCVVKLILKLNSKKQSRHVHGVDAFRIQEYLKLAAANLHTIVDRRGDSGKLLNATGVAQRGNEFFGGWSTGGAPCCRSCDESRSDHGAQLLARNQPSIGVMLLVAASSR